jgi:glycosyltransferase
MKVSIITVCYNSEATIENTIKSVLSQTHKNIEYIIVDGNSTDNTKAIIERYSSAIHQFISEPDKGLYDAMNKGLQLATGDIISILNSDDVYKDEQVLEQVLSRFSANTDAVYGDIVYVKRHNTSKIIRYWHAGNFKRYKMKYGWMPPHPAFFVKATIYKSYGTFNTSFKTSADYELMLRLIYKNNITLHYLPKLLVCMSDGGQGNASLKNRLKANLEDKKAWLVNGLTPPVFFRLLKPVIKIPQFLFRRKLE